MNIYFHRILLQLCVVFVLFDLNAGADTDRKLQVLEGLYEDENAPPATGSVEFTTDAGTRPVFGTLNGYDKGGKEALCFESSFPFNESRTELLEMDYLEQRLFDGVGTAKLLPSCYEGTTLQVGSPQSRDDLVEVEDQPTMFWNKVYTVHMKMSMYVPAVSVGSAFVPVPHVHFRLLWCDAVQTGFCNPLQDVRNSSGHNKTTIIDMYQGQVLNGIASTDDSFFLYTPWAKMEVETHGNGTITSSVNLTVTCPSWERRNNRPRAYFVIAQVLVASNDIETSTARRIDIGQTIPERVLYVQAQPDILTVTKSLKIFLCVVVGLGSAVALFCLGVILYYRKHPVMLLAQGNFLALLALVCLLQIFFTLTVLPTRDVFCHISFPLLQTLLTAIGAILVGRIWRIYSTLSAVNTLGKFKEKPRGERCVVGALDWLASLSTCFVRDGGAEGRRQSSRSLRRTVTARETIFLILVLVLPQAILQTIGGFVFDHSLVTQLDDHDIVGRVVCESKPLYFLCVTYLLTCILFFVTVLMAWFSRDLPSAFNEKDQIFNAASCGAIISAMSIALGRLLDEPTVTPDVVVILSALVYFGLAMITLVLLIWPKVGRVLFGGKIVMSHLLGSKRDLVSSSESKVSSISSPVSAFTTSSATSSLTLKAGDPLPGNVERKIFNVSTLLKSTLNNSADGQPLSQAEWNEVKEEISQLKSLVDNVCILDDSGIPAEDEHP